MTQFEYLSVLVSIIVGLALTQLLSGAARLIQLRRRVRMHAPTLLWMATLFLIDILLSHLKQWSPAAEMLLDGTPTVLVSRGKPDVEALRRARVSLDDVLESARQQHGLRRLDEVDFAVLEVGGKVSIIPKNR